MIEEVCFAVLSPSDGVKLEVDDLFQGKNTTLNIRPRPLQIK